MPSRAGIPGPIPSRRQARQRLLGPILSSVGVITMVGVTFATSGTSGPGKLTLSAAVLAGLALTLGGHYLSFNGGDVQQVTPLRPRPRAVARLATIAEVPVRTTITGFVILLVANFSFILVCLFRLFAG